MLKPAAAVTAVLAVLALAGCGSDETAKDTSTGTPATGASKQCSYPSDPAGSAGKKVTPPPATPTVRGEIPATISTSVGDLEITLDAAAAPCTVGSFVSLAQQGFYDGSHCHRLGDVPGFQMLQCGDPLGTGMGGPGYTIPDEYKGSETYPAGTLAMANAGQPNSGGSQFFMVFGDTQLQPQYTVFGHLDKAAVATLAQVAAKGIANPGQDGTGEPKEPVTFEKITVG